MELGSRGSCQTAPLSGGNGQAPKLQITRSEEVEANLLPSESEACAPAADKRIAEIKEKAFFMVPFFGGKIK